MVMRKNYQMWLLGALVGGLVLPFAGCSNEDDPTPNGPGSGEKVKTEFAITFTRGNTTKASTDEVGEGSFQGMTNMRLLGYNNAGLGTDNYVTEDMTLLDIIGLDPDIPSSAATTVTDGATGFKTLYSISLTPQPQSFMFYGESLLNYNSGGVGKLTAHYPQTSETADNTTFTLEKLDIKSTTEEDVLTAEKMMTYLTNVIKAAAAQVNIGQESQLTGFFDRFTSPAIHQIAAMLDQLYFATSLWKDAGQVVQTAIKTSCPIVDLSSFNGQQNGTLYTYIIETNGKNIDFDYLGTLYPKGGKALDIVCNTKTPDNSSVSWSSTDSNEFYRPTSLYYMANSYLVAYNVYDDLSWATTGTVQEGGSDLTTPVTPSSSTSKVALRDQVQYAVGQLYLDFKIDSKSMDDNLYGLNGTGGIASSAIKLKGILINNQKEVGWEFLPANTFATDLAYDNSVNNAETGGAVTANMLALPTKAQEPVTVVLELENTSGTAFEGVNSGIIPGYATFYAIATLNPKAASTLPEGVDRAEDLAVFMSDYKTTATLTLASLEDSYNTVPDLTDANLQFALSVDLSWKAGVNYGIVIGGED